MSVVTEGGCACRVQVGDTLCITQTAEKPDRVLMDGSSHVNMSDPLPSPASAQHGDWHYDDATGKLSYYSKSSSPTTASHALLLQ